MTDLEDRAAILTDDAAGLDAVCELLECAASVVVDCGVVKVKTFGAG
jgi:hypothetical protein